MSKQKERLFFGGMFMNLIGMILILENGLNSYFESIVMGVLIILVGTIISSRAKK
jgi:ribose/xylose/arabinose/galactoside ABC-type transport system permease subunit